jgi:hypothetical protein
MTTLAQLRTDLAAARVALRQAKDAHEIMRAVAETDAIERGVADGKNADERARKLTVALLYHDGYNGSITYLRDREADVDRLQAEIAIEEDRLRAEELRVREKLADALLGRSEEAAVEDETALQGIREEFAKRRDGRTQLRLVPSGDISDLYPEKPGAA